MDGGFGEAAPSHSAKPVASFPGTEDLLDPAPHPMDWLVPFLELLERRLFVTTPHAGGDDARDPALCTHSITKVAAAIGAVGEYLAGVIEAMPVRCISPHSNTIQVPVLGYFRIVLRDWCGRWESNPHGPKPNGFSYQLRLSPPPGTLDRAGAFVVWTIPSPCLGEPKGRCCPSSLYTFRSAFALRLGSGSPSDRVPRI